MKKLLGLLIILILLGAAGFVGFLAYKTLIGDDNQTAASSVQPGSYFNEDKAIELSKEYIEQHYGFSAFDRFTINVNGNDTEVYCVTFNNPETKTPAFITVVDKFDGRITTCNRESGADI